VIEARRFGFSHRGTGRRQLQDVTCEIPAGSRVAVMGATGAGKSTLAMALNGLVPHHHPGDLYGQLRVAGMATHEASLPQLVRVAGLVSQDPQAQVMERLVLDDAAAGPANLGLGRDEVLSRARRAAVESPSGQVKEMFVRPVPSAETSWTIMSILASVLATIAKMRAAAPGTSGTPTMVILSWLRSCAMPEMTGAST